MSRRWVARAIVAALVPIATLGAQRSPGELKALARDRLAQIDGRIEIPALDSSVEVRRDRWGVPHIYAKTTRDLFFAQGFIAAQDRLFQMDLWRRAGEGRLAEVLGPAYVERDRFARLLEYRGNMDAEWTSYAPDTKEIATNFVRGVNAYIALVRDRPPVEFTLLGYMPEPWSPEVPLQRMAALSMTGNARQEVLRAQLVALLGAKETSRLLPTIPHRELDPADGVSYAGINAASLGAYRQAVGPVRVPRIEGSNNWVVSGALTASGKPLLANDPHRSLENPSLRYLAHLVGPGWNVIGAGEPGVPGIAAGHNERIGFGFTIVGMDQQDLYVETVGACASGARCYLSAGAWKPVRRVVDTIAVRGEAPRVVTLEFTEHGPLIAVDDSTDGDGHRRAFALRFVGSEPGTAGYLAQLSVDRARDWSSFLDAMARWKLPTENIVYADVDGNIGWVAAGLMPKRSWSGLLPVPGSRAGFEWTGFRRVDELPQAYNPEKGFIATANHDIRPPGYDVPLNFDFATPFRANRITAVLGGARDSVQHGIPRRGFTVQDFQRLQHDELSLQAAVLVPRLVQVARAAGPIRSQRWEYVTLRAWDYVMRADSAAPLLFEVWKRTLSAAMARRLGGSDSAGAFLGGPSWLDEWESPDVALRLLPERERARLMLASMDTALVEIARRLGSDRRAWTWGALHKAAFPHRVSRVFDPAAVARGGNGTTVNATGGANYRQQAGASFREILDLSDWDRSVATSVPGQSGQPESEFYANLLPLWARGEYFPLVYSRPAVERETSHVLWLTPGKGGEASGTNARPGQPPRGGAAP